MSPESSPRYWWQTIRRRICNRICRARPSMMDLPFIERALALNPNLAWALWMDRSLPRRSRRRDRPARSGDQLSRLDGFRALGGIAFAHFLAGRYEEAITWAKAALRQRPTYQPAIRELAAASALAGRLPEAQMAMARLRQLDPARRVSTVKDWVPLRRPGDVRGLEEGLRLVGLPE
jgi:tetratricopeptide (TPR) repeat protein